VSNVVSDRIKPWARLPGTLSAAQSQIHRLALQTEANGLMLGKLLANQVKTLGPKRALRDAEFRVTSQWGDDGIIQYLIAQVPIASDTFVEFGVEDYTEANTRFLLVNDNWRGLVMDGSAEHMAALRQTDIHWRHDLTAIDTFITRENINGLISGAGFKGPLGVLSIDIDGNDYWVWEAIDVVDPAIVIVEYNSVFGATHAVTVPYAADFRRGQAHSSNLYWGASVRALCLLAQRKGYVFVGCNSNGNNAYFVKRSLAANVRELTPAEGYVVSRFRESRDPAGHLTYKGGDERLAAIVDMSVMDLERGSLVRLGDLVRGG
jgi:hypothetical protein